MEMNKALEEIMRVQKAQLELYITELVKSYNSSQAQIDMSEEPSESRFIVRNKEGKAIFIEFADGVTTGNVTIMAPHMVNKFTQEDAEMLAAEMKDDNGEPAHAIRWTTAVYDEMYRMNETLNVMRKLLGEKTH